MCQTRLIKAQMNGQFKAKNFRDRLAKISLTDKTKIRSITHTVIEELKRALALDEGNDINLGYQLFVDAAYRLKLLAEYDEYASECLVRIKRSICPSWYAVTDKSKIIKNINFMRRDYELLIEVQKTQL